MNSFLINWAGSTWDMMIDSAFLLFIGLVLAGLISVFLTPDKFRSFLGKSKRSQVFRAALIGVPLPLCSCSVLPVAHQLRKSGVGKGGTVSFLISTPETGIDSILLTYTLMDPLMTVARPITAFLTAFAAGSIESSFETDESEADQLDDLTESSCCSSGSCSDSDNIENSRSTATKLLAGVKYGLTDILDDLSPYLLLGYLLAGLVTAVIGSGLYEFSEVIQTGWGGYLAAILIGLPLYICATSSTPLAAALLATGFSPGAVLTFLMVGPATNLASLVLVAKILKGWAIARYLLSVLIVAVVCGIGLDYLYDIYPMESWSSYSAKTNSDSYLSLISAWLISGAVVFYSLKRLWKRFSS